MASDTIHTAVDTSRAMIQAATPLADWLVVGPVLTPLLAGALLLMLRKRLAPQPWIACAALAANIAMLVALLLRILADGPLTMMMGRWMAPFGIAFTADLAGVTFALASAAVALACCIYSVADIDGPRRRQGFYTFFLLMMAGINGAFLTGDIFNLYVWFEVLLIASFGLIVLGSEPVQLDGSLKYAFLNLVGTTLFLIATGYLYGTFGTLNMADLTMKLQTAPEGVPIMTIAALFATAFAMKAAAFPLNFWLPASYHTPRIVVSALFAGLLTKVGVYALLRVLVMIMAAQREALADALAIVAILTMILGVLGALSQSDIRRALGFLVVSGIGSMIAGVALSGDVALSGAIFYAVHSMIVMAALYLAAGVIGRRAGSFELKDLGGQYAASPWFAFGFLILAVSVAGLPPLSGFWPKLLIVRGALSQGQGWLAAAVLVTALLTSLAIFRVWLFVFWRGGPEGTRDGAEAWVLKPLSPASARLSGLSLGALLLLTVAIGLLPQMLVETAQQASRGLIDPASYIASVFGGAR